MVAAVNYSTIGVMLSLTCGMLLKGLSRSFTELELTSAAVARLNDMVLIAKAAPFPPGKAQPALAAKEPGPSW